MIFKMKSILITGCSSGIGYCVAKGLQQRGYHVIASARKDTDVERLKAEGLTCLQLDLDDSESIASAVEKTLQLTGGTLFALFNNGAFGLAGAVEDLSRDAIRAQFETNVFGWMELTNLILPIMRKQNEGRIIQNSSVLGFVGFPYRGAYNMSKFAIEGMTDTLRLELKDTNIQFSLIQPGPIESKFRENAAKAFRKYINRDASAHKQNYLAMKNRLQKEGHATAFTLPPKAVLEKVILALESKRAKIRYPVTTPTWFFTILKRLLTHRALDRILLKASGDGKN